MITIADLDELALSMPEATKEISKDGRPSYFVKKRTSLAVLVRIRDLPRIDRDERAELAAGA